VSITSIYTELHRRAALTGEDRSQVLTGGARLAVRVVDGVTTLTIARKTKRVGDTELITFRRDCGVPEDATRYPAEGQGTKDLDGATWHFVAFRWMEGEAQ
jgi:hypothetical protein